MADRSVRVVLSAQIADFQAKMGQAKSSVDDFGKTLDTHRQSADMVSSGLLKVGAVAAIGFGVAIKATADFEAAMSSVKATGDDAAANFDALRDAAIQMGADTSFSATEAAQGIEELMKAGVSARDVLGGGLKGALDLAAAGSLAVGDAAEIAATAMTQFGLSGAEVPHVADLLAAGAGKAQGEVADLGMALKQSGLVANQFGLSIEETVGGLSAFASAGLLGSDAGTSLKTMLQRLAAPSTEAATTMEQLGIAAYDSAGEFVGLEGLAGQLQTALSKLTPAQRDAAMATIFGSDAVRAANVLYQQGAAGIADWTAKVDDQGYAAEVAATKLDNLKGDVEKLGGSLETALIKGGTGANDALRGLTQTATGVVDAIGRIPGPVLSVAGGLAGLVAAGGLAAGGLIKAITTARDLKTAWNDLVPSGSKLEGKLKAVGIAAGVAGAAFAALTVYSQIAATEWKKTTASAGDLAAKISALGAVDLNKTFTFTEGALIKEQFDGIGASMQRLLNPTAVQAFGDMMNQGNSTAAKMAAQFQALDSALGSLASNGKAEQAAAQFKTIYDAAVQQGIGMDQLITLFPTYATQLRTAAEEQLGLNLTSQELAEWMAGKIPPAVQAAAAASKDATPDVKALAGGLDAVSQAATRAQESTKKYLGVISAKESQLALTKAADEATKAIEKNGKTLDEHTEKGQANWEVILGLATAYQQVSGTAEEVAAGQAHAAGKFLEAAKAAGLNRDAAADLAVKMLGIPKSLALQITAPGAELTQEQIAAVITATGLVPTLTTAEILAKNARPSKQEVDDLILALGTVPGMTEAQVRTIADMYGVEATQAALGTISDKTVMIDGNPVKLEELLPVIRANIDSTTGTITINGQAVPAEGALTHIVGLVNAGQGTITIDGNNSSAIVSVNAAKSYADGTAGTVEVDANTAPAQGAIDAVHGKTVTVTVTASYTADAMRILRGEAASGAIFSRSVGGALVRSYASGGIDEPRYVGSVGSRSPGIYPYAGQGGVVMNEAGSGPWEGIVSGNPSKRGRSRVITEEIARRLGGDVAWRAADGGFMGSGGSTPARSDAIASLADAIAARVNLNGAVLTVIDRGPMADSVLARLDTVAARMGA